MWLLGNPSESDRGLWSYLGHNCEVDTGRGLFNRGVWGVQGKGRFWFVWVDRLSFDSKKGRWFWFWFVELGFFRASSSTAVVEYFSWTKVS